jgi:hypothetical protein
MGMTRYVEKWHRATQKMLMLAGQDKLSSRPVDHRHSREIHQRMRPIYPAFLFVVDLADLFARRKLSLSLSLKIDSKKVAGNPLRENRDGLG